MRSAIVLAFAVYVLAFVLFGWGGPLWLAGVGMVGSGLILLVDWWWHEHRPERRSLRRLRRRVTVHRCPECGISHGGAGQ